MRDGRPDRTYRRPLPDVSDILFAYMPAVRAGR
jgi:hypothetical protein